MICRLTRKAGELPPDTFAHDPSIAASRNYRNLTFFDRGLCQPSPKAHPPSSGIVQERGCGEPQ
jgi:hypothetical protein